MSIQFIDLKAQYQHLKADIDARIHAVLDHGQYIMGPEVKEVEAQLAAYTGAKYALDAIISGRHIPAPEAKSKGIVDALVEGDPASGYSVRRDGFTVSATAIDATSADPYSLASAG